MVIKKLNKKMVQQIKRENKRDDTNKEKETESKKH